MKTKKDINYSFQHTKERILERYGREITREWYDTMCNRISNTSYGWNTVDFDGDQMIVELELAYTDNIIVVWSDKRNCITTALKDWRKNV